MLAYHSPCEDAPETCAARIKNTLATFHHMGRKAGGPLGVFVVTHNTKDFGHLYVVRRVTAVMESNEATSYASPYFATATNLEELRQVMPDDCVIFSRSPNDDPVIVETWI